MAVWSSNTDKHAYYKLSTIFFKTRHLEFNASGSTGQIGQVIRVKAQDDTQAISVQVPLMMSAVPHMNWDKPYGLT
jgi:hypothetical protein